MSVVITQNGRRLQYLVTIVAGTPVLISNPTPIWCDRVLVQSLTGSVGQILVYNDVPVTDPGGVQPPATGPTGIAAVCGHPVQLAPATSTAPGGSYTEDPSSDPFTSVDGRTFAIDGTNSGDVALVDLHLKV